MSTQQPADDLCTETLTIRIDQRTLQRIEQLATANGLKRSEYIRDILKIAAENRLKITLNLETFQLPNLSQ
jgi:antitoxin component of RelBE/YafQ-DinJ toxin-antitoxin module